jgi:hypothetical protein
MNLKILSVGASVIALSIFTSCGKVQRTSSRPLKKPAPQTTQTTQTPTNNSADNKTVDFSATCAKLTADTDALTNGLRDICIASENGAKQIKLTIEVITGYTNYDQEVRYNVTGGDAATGLTRDTKHLLGVKTAAELKSLVCSTHSTASTSAMGSDLFDFYPLASNVEVPDATTDAEICTHYDWIVTKITATK